MQFLPVCIYLEILSMQYVNAHVVRYMDWAPWPVPFQN